MSHQRVYDDDIFSLVKKRDAAAREERSLEAKIFDSGRTYEFKDTEDLLDQYREVKTRRLELSVEVARRFMQLSREKRTLFSESWFLTSEGKRKLRDYNSDGSN